MIKQDYIIRMIQEIISMIVTAIIKRKDLTTKSWRNMNTIRMRC